MPSIFEDMSTIFVQPCFKITDEQSIYEKHQPDFFYTLGDILDDKIQLT